MKIAQVFLTRENNQAWQTFLHDQHRYYGDSLPFGDDSYNSAETQGYLTSTQALADFAILITSLKRNLSAESAPVVVFGGSYGGSKSFLNIINMHAHDEWAYQLTLKKSMIH